MEQEWFTVYFECFLLNGHGNAMLSQILFCKTRLPKHPGASASNIRAIRKTEPMQGSMGELAETGDVGLAGFSFVFILYRFIWRFSGGYTACHDLHRKACLVVR